MQKVTAGLKHRVRGVWRDTELVDPNTHNNKLATYHSWFATPFSRDERMPTIVPRYLHLDLSKHVMRNVSRLRLRAHFLKLRQQRGLKVVLAYATSALVKEDEHACPKRGARSFILPRSSGL